MKNNGITTYVPIWRGDPYGDGIHENLKIYFEESGGSFETGSIRYNTNSNDFSANVSALADKISDLTDKYGKEKVAVVLVGFEETALLVQSANSHDILHKVQWFGTNTLTHTNILQNNPLAMELVKDVNFTALIVKPELTYLGEDVIKYVSTEICRNASMFALASYDIPWIYGMSILQTQSDRTADIKPILEQVVSEYNGTMGKIVLNKYGDLKSADYTISTLVDKNWIDIGVYKTNGTLIMYP
ncbi:MAG: ABC-type branched-chain amino acid transport system, periplasmic component [Cenarchaeum symbiont of Oopsacas minuta]|nr:ABC-type branched-chain amino acid transport system, periplasmic component [Cenarchaeum symbiont of Oopsacas minuta]